MSRPTGCEGRCESGRALSGQVAAVERGEFGLAVSGREAISRRGANSWTVPMIDSVTSAGVRHVHPAQAVDE